MLFLISWKQIATDDNGESRSLVLQDHHIFTKNHILSSDKITSKEIYKILISSNHAQPSNYDLFYFKI